MKLLAFETATEACSVAVWDDGRVLERFGIVPRRHAELALPWAEDLLAEAGVARSQLDAIAVGRGPGAFTGVRLAIALAQGIALALDRPVVALSTLAVLAMRGADAAGPGGHVLAAIDARMGEVYSAAFALDAEGPRLLDDERVGPPASVALPEPLAQSAGGAWHGVGTGFAAGDGALAARLGARMAGVDATALPRAGDLARLGAAAFARGEAVAADRIEPAYLRDNVALTIAEQQALRAAR
ncbi:tRNA (adenosine(37)-N6)-threonylcarbamoyltransferase complex dimerization subunit type 1 TsaB [Luteimonas sp. BDR2-5]|uniref:tRNA (adenosine(37)-N6)-threonylcarbamoyltransferase complex dimerization subunit type 1 TsaB n=1 Tax=Proluteimonas luteida TaxID=2878685 RepID=UPI001E37D29D|nr:tRNA (adenosine(37)-N6)-threonylcarbamoyltransferase complex dimerization subunit type 1 TsaB [Luteimonas sp. BDR2-5]MCD9027464.1 tRNA (adenosine(37)-N6)-threonylcarbamoyltransferase complex dimerization subunit type 1 TsaB [Luteimonas sp. BDR2-5]